MTNSAGVHTTTYDAANRLTRVDDVTYTWDARGNLTNDGTNSYAYDGAGRMVQVTTSVASLVYTYTADGLRVAQNVGGIATTFVWDWATGVPEMLSDGDHLYLVGYDTLGWWDGDTWTFALPDALGSVRHETDIAGTVTDAREWTPFGVEVGNRQTGLGYTGEWQAYYRKFVYLRARWYDVENGRFTSPDTIVPDYFNPGSIHEYQYTFGNPINYVDPNGHDPLSPEWENEFKTYHQNRLPGWWDRLIRLYSIAFPDEWNNANFYDSEGGLIDGSLVANLRDQKANRSWEDMPGALVRLASHYGAYETEAFVRDVGFLFGGLPDRFEVPSTHTALTGCETGFTCGDNQVVKLPGPIWTFIEPCGLPENLTLDSGGDSNVHHWAWGVVLGYHYGSFGIALNTVREYKQDGLVIFGKSAQSRRSRSDIWLGNRAVMMGNDIRVYGASPEVIPELWHRFTTGTYAY